MSKLKLTDDEFIDRLRQVRAWKERDDARQVKYRELLKESNLKRKRRLIIWVTSSAAALILLVLYLPWVHFGLDRSPDGLYQQFYEPYQFASFYRDGEKADQNLYLQAVILYQSKNFRAADKIAESLIAETGAEPDNLLLAGLIKQALGEYEAALRYYNALIPIGGSFAQNALWYHALVNLKLGKKMECKMDLAELDKLGGSFYSQKAEKLRRGIE